MKEGQIKCAIYTRVSTDNQAEKALNHIGYRAVSLIPVRRKRQGFFKVFDYLLNQVAFWK